MQFLDRNNEVLNDRAPNFFLLVVFTGGGTALTGLILDNSKHFVNNNLGLMIVGMMPILIPTLYCILKNFPIATYFKKETWIADGTQRSYGSSRDSARGTEHGPFSRHISQINSPYNKRYNPSHSYLATNIYYRRK